MVHRARAEHDAAVRAAALRDGGVVGGLEERSNRYRSVDEEETSPVDNAILAATAPWAARTVEYGVTPNHVSILGGVLALASLVALFFGHLFVFVLLMLLSYCCDMLDGWMART